MAEKINYQIVVWYPTVGWKAGNKKAAVGRAENFLKGIDKRGKVGYNNDVGATDSGCFLVQLKDNRRFGRRAVIFFYFGRHDDHADKNRIG